MLLDHLSASVASNSNVTAPEREIVSVWPSFVDLEDNIVLISTMVEFDSAKSRLGLEPLHQHRSRRSSVSHRYTGSVL